jgi:hypothetical protein
MYASSLRDTNSVKSRTRFVLGVSPCVRSQRVPYLCRSVPGSPYHRRVGIADEAWQRRHPEPLPYRDDLCLGIRGPERNVRAANLTLVCPVRNAGMPSKCLMTYRTGSGAPARTRQGRRGT